jgi:hypothetical protein
MAFGRALGSPEDRGNGTVRFGQCAQCNADDDGQLIKFGDVYLHKECKPFWFGQR